MAQPFDLNDAITVYFGRIDNAHKLWGYVQIVTVGAAGFAWSDKRPMQVHIVLLIGLIVFGIANAVLLYKSQRQAAITAAAITNYWRNHTEAISEELRPIIAVISPAAPWALVLMQSAIIVAGIAAVSFARTA